MILVRTPKKLFLVWIIVMFIGTSSALLTYLIAQQALRLSANDLPVQASIETSIKLKNGMSPSDALPKDKVDIDESLNVFVLIYDSEKKLVVTNGIKNEGTVSYPIGVFIHVKETGDHRVTWLPAIGIRYASVVRKTNGYYIIATQSLTETERHINHIGLLVLLAWLAYSVMSMGTFLLLHQWLKRDRKVTDIRDLNVY